MDTLKLASKRRKAIIATVIGNGLEWFDFTVYSYFAIILATVFFPTGNYLTSLLLTVATFGVGFIMRPIGGIILGIYGDKVGRKAALTITILMMATSTLVIGLTPSFETIGFAAPVIIVLARLAQGFSAGGEMGSASAFLTENAPENRRSYYASWILSSIGFSVVLGAVAGTLVTLLLDEEALQSWGWRIPFILGSLIGPIGYYFRTHLNESPAFEALKDKKEKTPLRDVLSNHLRETTVSLLIVILWTVSFYILLFYMPTYASGILGMPKQDGFISGIMGGLTMMIAAPLAGLLADRIGSRVVMLIAAIFIFLLAWPMFAYINAYQTLASLIVFQCVFGILSGIYTGPIIGAFAHLFPTQIMSTGVSVAYNFAVTIFGGFASLIVTWFIAFTGNNMSPAFYVMIGAGLSIIGVLYAPKRNGWIKGI